MAAILLSSREGELLYLQIFSPLIPPDNVVKHVLPLSHLSYGTVTRANDNLGKLCW